MRLGVLTALWSLVESTLCGVLTELLGDRTKAEAVFYSTTNHKARRDMVMAVGAASSPSPGMTQLLAAALDATADAASARNDLLHGLFQSDLTTGGLVSVVRRPARKKPHIMRTAVLDDIERAIALCGRAMQLLETVAVYLNPQSRAFLEKRGVPLPD